jgi:hypothetical protein
MQPTEIAIFTVTLFVALVSLIQCRIRREMAFERVNRGLRGYVVGPAQWLRK